MTKTIMLFSGGADSAFIAYKLLTETTDELTTLTLMSEPGELVSWSPRGRFLLRLDALLNELQKIRSFTVIKKIVKQEEIHPENDHAYLYGIEYVAPFINDGTYDRFVTGRTWEQQNQSLFKGSTITGTPTYFASCNLWTKLTTRGEMYDPLVDATFYPHFNRWHILKHLPENISRYTISCHNPKVSDDGTAITDCDACYKCLWEEKAKEFISKGYSAEQLNAWRRLKSLEYGGGNNVSCPMRYWLPLEMGKGDILNYIKADGISVKLSNKNIIASVLQSEDNYTYRDRPKTGIWDFTNLLNGS